LIYQEKIALITGETHGFETVVAKGIENASIIKRTPLTDMEVADFKAVIDVDLVAPFIISKHIVKGIIERNNGKIINICL